jgi:hypothetical protein
MTVAVMAVHAMPAGLASAQASRQDDSALHGEIRANDEGDADEPQSPIGAGRRHR